jgi:hypothetical protein
MEEFFNLRYVPPLKIACEFLKRGAAGGGTVCFAGIFGCDESPDLILRLSFETIVKQEGEDFVDLLSGDLAGGGSGRGRDGEP